MTVFTIHKLRGQTSEKDEALIVQRLTELGVCPKTLLGNLDAYARGGSDMGNRAV